MLSWEESMCIFVSWFEAIILEKSNNDWQKIIAKTFAQVLAQELTTEKLLMADDENTYFAKQINSEAKQLVMDLEVMEWAIIYY